MPLAVPDKVVEHHLRTTGIMLSAAPSVHQSKFVDSAFRREFPVQFSLCMQGSDWRTFRLGLYLL